MESRPSSGSVGAVYVWVELEVEGVFEMVIERVGVGERVFERVGEGRWEFGWEFVVGSFLGREWEWLSGVCLFPEWLSEVCPYPESPSQKRLFPECSSEMHPSALQIQASYSSAKH